MSDLIVILVMGIVSFLPIIGYWRLFEKAQQRGWKVLIPIYNFIIYFRIIRRPAWWILLYLIPPIWIFLIPIDCYRCHTLFGMNIERDTKIKNSSWWYTLCLCALSPYILGRMMISGFFGFPNISFNRKAFYSIEYVDQSAKDKSPDELVDINQKNKEAILKE